ncbi:MAG TPA: aminoglycoside phosphotransferase family protein [Acidimicrobiales bacterium]|nr:aminoglycoside phosphotransferase family protein [Acidimicrobiales bacterium]
MVAARAGASSYSPRPVSAPHGFSDDEATRRLLRSRPPRAALAWAGKVIGGTVVSARALRGGTSSAVHVLAARSGDCALQTVVLRRYVRSEVNLEEPGIVRHEANALRVVEPAAVPTPELLAADETGEEAGVPALLMSRLRGRVEWSPGDFDNWLRRLAELLPMIHAAKLAGPDARGLPLFVPYEQSNYEPPAWSRTPVVWERAVEIFHGPALSSGRVFIQRDFHPGNVLWNRGAVSGVVDWQDACTGPAVADVAHCRANLFRYGLDVADRFTAIWERFSGLRYDPWAEVVGIIGMLGSWQGSSGRPHPATEEALARAVALLGP